MTPEQITSISREYAEEIHADTSEPFKDDVVREETENTESAFRWLLKRFCLVEKSKLREAYKDAQKDQYNTERDFALTLAGRNRSAVLVELFPEIAEEVEDA